MNSPSGAAEVSRRADSGSSDELGELLKLICETPAPTFAEEERAALLVGLLRGVDLDPRVDAVGNVIAEVPAGSGPRVLLAAHLDTVFGPDVDVKVRTDGNRWSAPGIGDNSASLAVLVHLLRELRRGRVGEVPRITVAATVGEEGLGDLRGARSLVDSDEVQFDYFIAIDGHLGTVVDAAVGSRRYEVSIEAAGGHSWGDFPAPSATHALGAMVAALGGLKVPTEPRSSYNVGQVWGGTGVNAIAQRAGFNLDLRSVDPATLEGLEEDVLGRLRRVAKKQRVGVDWEKVGDRPAGKPTGFELSRLAREALTEAGVEARIAASSTDANMAIAAGIPAIAFGVYRGGDAHRMSEWLDRPSLEIGYQALVGFLGRLVRLSPQK